MIINKILDEAALLSESRTKKVETLRDGNHEDNPRDFVSALGIKTKEFDPEPLRELRNYIVQGMRTGFLKTMVTRCQMETPTKMVLEFDKVFHNNKSFFGEPIEMLGHVLGAIIEGLRAIDFYQHEQEFELRLVGTREYHLYEKGEE